MAFQDVLACMNMGQKYFHFVLKLDVILRSGLNLNVPHDYIKRTSSGTIHRATILNCKLGYHITLHRRKRPGLKINMKHVESKHQYEKVTKTPSRTFR